LVIWSSLYVGYVSLLAGFYESSDYIDGTGTNARLLATEALAVDINRNIYTGDGGGYIRKVTTAGKKF
jgi:hypothetical protein